MSLSHVKANFRDHLQDELIQRLKRNPQYSLRAFAKTLKVDPSQLSKILHRKRRISVSLIRSIGTTLELSPGQIHWYLQAERIDDHSPYPERFQALEQDAFEVIADWYHFAILELMNVNGFTSSAEWIATSLGLSVIEARSAIERLCRVGLLEINPEGLWKDLSKGRRSFNLGTNYSSVAHRKAQKQILELSTKSIDDVPIERRDHSSMMMATTPKKLEQAKAMIDKFRYDLCHFLEATDDREMVYQLSISLFPVSKSGESNAD